jgi:HK97 family phage major capsid protein
MTKKYTSFNTFGEQLQTIWKVVANPSALNGDTRLNKINAAAIGAGESVPSSGGFLVEPGHSEQIFNKTYNTGELLKRVVRVSLKRKTNNATLIDLEDSDRGDGSRFGGATANWNEEGNEISATAPTFRAMNLNLHKLAGLIYATDELIEDVPLLGTVLMDAMSKEIVFKLEDSMINGSGAGRPKGILDHSATIAVPKETGQVASTITAENIIKMWSRCWGASRKNAVWLINQDAEEQLMQMYLSVGLNEIPMYQPASGPTVEGYPSLFGRPVIPSEYCQTLGTKGDIILFDPSQYMFMDSGIDEELSLQVRFEESEGAFKYTLRTDGQPTWQMAQTPKNGTATVSPYVTLATRA